MVVHKMVVALAAASIVAVAGCSSDDSGSSDATRDLGSPSESFEFGQPADGAEADRTIQVEADDSLSFDPEIIDVAAGEVVTFSVANVGDLPHEFTLGPADVQREHEEEMAAMGDMEMHGDANALAIPAGETRELTWRFSEPGTIMFGCHVQGHYDAGMVGEIEVTEGAA